MKLGTHMPGDVATRLKIMCSLTIKYISCMFKIQYIIYLFNHGLLPFHFHCTRKVVKTRHVHPCNILRSLLIKRFVGQRSRSQLLKIEQTFVYQKSCKNKTCTSLTTGPFIKSSLYKHKIYIFSNTLPLPPPIFYLVSTLRLTHVILVYCDREVSWTCFYG
jgi:hypothetical protein